MTASARPEGATLALPLRADAGTAAVLASPAGIEVELTPAGDVRALRAPDDLLVNQYQPGAHDPATGGLYLRRTTEAGTEAVALVGSRSSATCTVADGVARWDGSGLGARWTVTLVLDAVAMAWVWRIDLSADGAAGAAGVTGGAGERAVYDVAALQDLSLAPRQMAQSSEAYVSQYVAHRLEQDERYGRVVLSRQTMAAAPVLPLAAFAIVEGAAAAGTDAFDLVTPGARSGATPAFLTGEPWPDRVRQHEMSTAGLLSRSLDLTIPATLHVAGRFWADHRDAMTDVLPGLGDDVARLVQAAADAVAPEPAETGDERSLLATAPVLTGDSLSDDELAALGDGLLHVERDADGGLLSFFTTTGAHVVRGEKDLALDRPHGHVLLAGDSLDPQRPTLSTTVYAHGVVSSHTVLGNTSFDRLTSVHRNHLNLLRSNGVRVLVRHEGTWQLLGQPSAFVLDIGEARWVYRLGAQTVEVRTVAAASSDALLTEITTTVPADVLVTTDVDLADAGWQAELLDEAGTVLRFRPAADSNVARHHDALTYAMTVSTGTVLGGDGPLFADGADRGTSVVTALATGATSVRLAVTADLAGGSVAVPAGADVVTHGLDAATEAAGHRATLAELTRGLRVDAGSRFAELEVLAPWWAHDGRVHFLVPHGLEQYSGAAWGTRDVSQGPFELMLGAGRFETCRDIIVRVLSRQAVDGSFPQWFMFDDYAEVLQDHSHGDIPVWPLFALGQYLRATGDLSILDAVTPFRDGGDATVLEHVATLVEHQATHRVPGTALPAYGDGDWDDTLQPARREMRAGMASTWTSALLYQALTLAAGQLAGTPRDEVTELAARMEQMAADLKADIRTIAMPGGITAGFVTVNDGEVVPVIHPQDASTGLTYRLIPMTRMMIAGVFEPEEVVRHEAIVREHLHFPDGVRLTNKPARFADGQVESFLRAEQAAFFGREVGLMYAHAHIRWTEALASVGRADMGTELLRLSPIGMRERVPSALPRQRTCFTSSSDGAFPDRYTAARDFDKLRTGEVPTADGWRVYSSGPGIFLRQLLQNLLGLDERHDALVVAPTLAPEDDGLEIEIVLAGRRRTVRYVVDPAASGVSVALDGVAAPTTPVAHRYRTPGASLPLAVLGEAAVVEITTPAGTPAGHVPGATR